MTYDECCQSIDWELLARQRRNLESILNNPDLKFDSDDPLWGLVELLYQLECIHDDEVKGGV